MALAWPWLGCGRPSSNTQGQGQEQEGLRETLAPAPLHPASGGWQGYRTTEQPRAEENRPQLWGVPLACLQCLGPGLGAREG